MTQTSIEVPVAPPIRVSHRITDLDALRGIAAVMVLLYHYTYRYNLLYHHDPGLIFYFKEGRLGVPLFFIISGFVILMTLDRSKRIRDFAIGRFARLYPAYWTAVLVTFTVVTVAGLPGRQASWREAAWNVTMVQDLFGVDHVDGVYWTLCIELLFYALMASLIAMRLRTYLSMVLTGLLIFHLVCPHTSLVVNWRLHSVAVSVDSFLDQLHLFLLGIVIYEAKTTWRWWHFPLIVLCLVCTFVDNPDRPWFSLVAVAVIATIVWAATHLHIPGLANPVLLFLGMISYTLYLVHQNIGYVIIRWCYAHGINRYAAIIAAATIAVGLATGITFMIEKPAMRWIRRRYEMWRMPAPAVAAPTPTADA